MPLTQALDALGADVEDVTQIFASSEAAYTQALMPDAFDRHH